MRSFRRPTLAVICAVATTVAAVGVDARPAAAANQVQVTTTRDVVDSSDGVVSLREAFDIANSDGQATIVVLEDGQSYELTICADIDENENADGDLDHTPDESIEIEGRGATIVQNCPRQRVLHHLGAGTNLTTYDLTITGGDARLGESEIYASNVLGGGGILSMGGVDLTRTNVRGNQTSGLGGGVRAVKASRLIDSTVAQNSGGGVAIGSVSWDGYTSPAFGTSVVSATAVVGNSGRGLDAYGASIQVSGGVVADNSADGIHSISGDVEVSATSVVDNGGVGIGVYGGSAQVSGSSVLRNADDGVSITASAASVTGSLATSTISHNGRNGVFVSDAASLGEGPSNLTHLDVVGVTVSNNLHSGLYLVGPGTLDVSSSDISYNNASGVTCDECRRQITLNDSLVDENLRGGFLVFDGAGADVAIQRSAFRRNTGSSTSNSALLPGGGLLVSESDGARVSIDDSDFEGNRAALGGGDIAVVASQERTTSVSVDGSSFVASAADGPGGSFLIDGGTVVIRSSTIDSSSSAVRGAAIDVLGDGWLTLERAHVSKVRGSVAISASQYGRVEIVESLIEGDPRGEARLGAIDVESAVDGHGLLVSRSTITGFRGESTIYVDGSATALVSNSTISGNEGDAFVASADSFVTFTTVFGNGNGLIATDGSTVHTAASVVSNGGAVDCQVFGGGTIASLGNNAIGDWSCGFGSSGDREGLGTAGVMPLADNGGPAIGHRAALRAPTHALGDQSPLVDYLAPPFCAAVDQRGMPRPQGSGCDVGAFEQTVLFP